MYKPLVSILGDFYENRFLFTEALYVVNLPSVHCTSLWDRSIWLNLLPLGHLLVGKWLIAWLTQYISVECIDVLWCLPRHIWDDVSWHIQTKIPLLFFMLTVFIILTYDIYMPACIIHICIASEILKKQSVFLLNISVVWTISLAKNVSN